MKDNRLIKRGSLLYFGIIITLVFNNISVKAQILNDPQVSWDSSVAYTPVCLYNVWHIVEGTQITVTLEASIPESTNEKRYEKEVIYVKDTENLSSNTDTFVPADGTISYTAIFKYKIYTQNADTQEWQTDNILYEEKSEKKEITFKLYPVPSIEINSLTPSAESTYDGGLRITLTLVSTTNASEVEGYTEKIEWKEGAAGSYVEGGPTYDFNPAGKSSTTIYCRVSIIGPDGSVWGTPQERSVTINVLPAPSIEIKSLTPSSQAAYDGGPHITLTLVSTTNASEVEGYTEKIEWKEGAAGSYVEGGPTYDFNPAGKSSTTVYCRVSIIGPDGNVWGIPQEKSVIINVYSVPEYTSKGIHRNKEDDTIHKYEYSTYKNIVFDASQLFTFRGGNPNGWQNELYVAPAGEEGEKMPGLTFKPDKAGDYTLRLVLKNVAPFDDSEVLFNENYEYILHVYDKPTWTTNVAELFADVNDTGMYNDINNIVRHVRSGDIVPFEINVQGGDATKMDVKMTIGNKEGVFNTSNLGKYTFNFQEVNDSDKEKEYIFNIHISNNIDYLVEGQETYSKDISGKIIVWKDIMADVVDLHTETDGIYIIEMCEDNAEDQKIKLNLTGGNPDKWNVMVMPDKNCPSGIESRNGHEYTYLIKGADLKAGVNAAKIYKYTVTIQYVDGPTITPKVTKSIDIKVWPKPEISSILSLKKDGATITYIGKEMPSENKIVYTVNCYEEDELVLSVNPSGGNTESVEESWKYEMTGSSERKQLPNDKKITFLQGQGGTSPMTIRFFNKLKTKEVLSVETIINRHPRPNVTTVLPNIDNTTNKDWTDAEEKDGKFLAPVHLYGGGTQTASFLFSPKSGNEGYIEGWTYSCNVGTIKQSMSAAQWDYNVKSSTSSSYEDQIIKINIKNSIPASENQSGENIGFQGTKIYHIRVWHEAVLPSDYSLTDNNNLNNNIKTTHAIREGNALKAHVNPIEFGYNPEDSGSYYEYLWEGQGSVNQNDWQKINMTNSDDRNGPGRSKTTYKLTVRNKGPRGTNWVVKSFNDCDVYIYNRPETPTKLIKKGNGTSGTMIVEFNDISDEALLARGDYVIDFNYTDASGEHKVIAKPQTERGDIRWATGYTNTSQIDNAFVYSHWLDAENGVLITSGKRTLNGVDENWDGSMYNLTPEQISGIRAMTRVGDGNYTEIHTIQPDEMCESDVSVYNINGTKIGTTTKGLNPGIYIIRYTQDGITMSRKLSVK